MRKKKNVAVNETETEEKITAEAAESSDAGKEAGEPKEAPVTKDLTAEAGTEVKAKAEDKTDEKSEDKADAKAEKKTEKKTELSAESRTAKLSKKQIAAGVVTFIFAVIGLAFLIYLIVSGISRASAASEAAAKKNYQKMLVPVVMNDPDTFDDIDKASMPQLVDISIWAILKSDIDTSKFKYEDNQMLIPASAVEKQYKKLFGTQRKIKHQTVSGASYQFTYDTSKKVYKIPITGVEPTYTPQITDISKKSSSTVLTVAYLSGGLWEQDENGDMTAPSASKYVKITLRENDDGTMYISSIQDTDAPEQA
jgi:Ca2+/Na+ antiporter